MSDGKYITGGVDVQVNLYDPLYDPLWVYEGGWFIMRRPRSSNFAGPDKGLVLRAFGYDPIDALVTIEDGVMTYLDFELTVTPAGELASVTGVVADEGGQPFFGATVMVYFNLTSFGIGNMPFMEATTDEHGEYLFTGLSSAEHVVLASASGYAHHSELVTPPAGGVATQDRRLYPNRQITIEYAYQTDGTRSFLGDTVETGFINWLHGAGGVDFSEGVVEGYEQDDVRDLELRQIQDILQFRIFYVSGGNGYYDAGSVDFDALLEAASSGYIQGYRPCLVGHVYVVRTYKGIGYAKFLVKSDEASFRTVVPGDPAPIEFAGYGLTIDFSYSSDYAQVFVEKHFADVPLLGPDALPYFLDISGMSGVAFSADLIIRYDEADVIQRRLFEQNLTLLQSTDQGQHWFETNSMLDPVQNTLTVEGLTSFGDFAIADLSERIPGDTDGDGDVDLQDIAGFQRCFSGPGTPQDDTACVAALFDGDDDVDGLDFVALSGCVSAPDTPADPACAD